MHCARVVLFTKAVWCSAPAKPSGAHQAKRWQKREGYSLCRLQSLRAMRERPCALRRTSLSELKVMLNTEPRKNASTVLVKAITLKGIPVNQTTGCAA